MTVTDYLTVEQAAHLLQVHPETVRRMLRERRLAGARLGGRRAGWRIPAGAVERLLTEGGALAPSPRHDAAPSSERRERMLAQLRAQAERARKRGDDAGAARFEAMRAELDGTDTLD